MRLILHIDFGSPYAYLAWQRLRQQPERYAGADLEFVGVSAAHIFRHDGSAPNSTLPNQGSYLERDVRRIAARLGVPFNPPPKGTPGAMPVRSIEALRLLPLAQQEGLGEAWIEAVFRAYFEDGLDIGVPANIIALATQVGLPEPAAALEARQWKQALIDNTGAAYQRGAPGVPYFWFPELDEGFWGQDRMDWVEARLRGDRTGLDASEAPTPSTPPSA